MSPGESYSQWELIWNSQLIGRYKEMSPGESYRAIYSPNRKDIKKCYQFETGRAQSELFTFQCSQWAAHLKQSTNKKI